MLKLFAAILVLLLSSCGFHSPYISLYEKRAHIKKLEKEIDKILGINNSHLVLKYDLLDIGHPYGSEYDSCLVSKLYYDLYYKNNERDGFYKQLFDVKSKINQLVNIDDYVGIINLNLNKKTNIINKALIVKGNKKHKFTKVPDEIEIGSLRKRLKNLARIDKEIENIPFINPIPYSSITSDFGLRNDPIHKKKKKHLGIDLKSTKNAKIFAPANGEVIFVGKVKGYGNLLTLDHGHGITTNYAHVKKIYVKLGDYVVFGQPIAVQGASGRVTSDHLHYEIRIQNVPINPRKFLNIGANCNLIN